jgi:hypothetical protein
MSGHQLSTTSAFPKIRKRLPLVGRSTSLFHVSTTTTTTTTTTTLLWKNMTAFPTRLSRLRLAVIFASLLSVFNLLYVHKTLLQSAHAEFEQNSPPVPSQSGDINTFSSTNFFESSTNRRMFSDPNEVHRLVALGPNFLTTKSGCRMARWFYPTTIREGKYRDCRNKGNNKKMLFRTDQLHHNDTIYVTFAQLEEFVREMLPTITVDVVVLSGQIMKTPSDEVVSNQTIKLLLDSPHVLHWFCQNLPLYGGEDPHHPKISPFPYGLREIVNKPELNQALEEYKEVFLQTIRDDVASAKHNSTVNNRTTMIYAGYIRQMRQRKNIPTLRSEIEPAQFYRNLANSTYILSPNGDRPECYRHYEAIGLGAVPITELDPILFRHLREGPVIFNNTNWNLKSLELELHHQHHHHPPVVVNRNMVLEEYWIEFIDWTVRRSLRWWGRHSDKPQALEGMLEMLEQVRRKRNRKRVRSKRKRRKRNREIVTREKEREKERKKRIREEARQRAIISGKFARQESNTTAGAMR